MLLAAWSSRSARCRFFARVDERISRTEHIEHELRNALGALPIVRGALQRRSDALPLYRHDHRDSSQEDQESNTRDHSSGMPTHEPLRVVDPVALARLDRLVLQVMADVRDQPFHRAIAMLRLLAQRAHDDRIDVADQTTSQPLRGNAARKCQCGDRLLVLRRSETASRAERSRSVAADRQRRSSVPFRAGSLHRTDRTDAGQ